MPIDKTTQRIVHAMRHVLRPTTFVCRAAAGVMAAAIALFLLAACSRSSAPHCTPGDKARLAAIDDSIARRALSARELVEQGMRATTDSLRYYEYSVRMGKYFLLSATPDSMHPFIDRAIDFALRQKSDPHVRALLSTAYACRATRLHYFHQSPDSAIAYYRRAYGLLMSSDNQENAPRLCGNLADAYFFHDDLPEAAAWYRRALFLVDSLALPKSENVTLYLGLARIYMNLNDFATSRRYYEQTALHYGSMPPSMQAYFLNDYGSYFYYSHDYRSALTKFRQLEQMLVERHMDSNFDMYLCRLNLADVYLNLGMTAEAKRCLALVEPYFVKMDDATAVYYLNTIKVGLALRDGDMAAVKRLLASERADFVPMYNMRHIRNGYLRDYYVRTGDYRRAYDVMEEDNRQTDSLLHNRSNMRAAEIMDRFAQDTLRLHHSLAMEQKNADIYRSDLVAVGLALAVVTLGLLLALWVAYSRKQMLRNRISVMQLKLTSARNRINPHFVFNVLNNSIAGGRVAHETGELLELTRLIRTNLDMSCRMTVSLADELEFVRRYIDVERPLLEPGFTFAADVSDAVDPTAVQVPSMFLQILVENAIVHGLKGRDGDKRLHIGVERDGNATAISVEDNGPGFDARFMSQRKGTGLGIITQTVAVINEYGSRKMRFAIRNIAAPDGTIAGCVSTLLIPDGMRMPGE